MSTAILMQPCSFSQHRRAFTGSNMTQHSRAARMHRTARRRCRCAASTAATSPREDQLGPSNTLLIKAVELLFSIKPIFSRASAAARQRIVDRSKLIGQDFEAEVARLQSEADWPAELAAAANPDVAMPSYYTQPFHAYADGNLCWDAAMEFEVASRSVHASVLEADASECDPQGDDKFRAAYMDITRRFMEQAGAQSVEQAVDLGCATGLSSDHVRRAFPGAQVTGIDLSPHMVAVGRHLQQQRLGELKDGEKTLRFVHANAEDTGLPAGEADLVTLCLVAHELPQSATAAIFREAYRLLRPGGALAVMEMDPASSIFRRIFGNPAAYVAFKSTEPWLMEYVDLDMPAEMTAAGFLPPQQAANSPRHKTVVAIKPE